MYLSEAWILDKLAKSSIPIRFTSSVCFSFIQLETAFLFHKHHCNILKFTITYTYYNRKARINCMNFHQYASKKNLLSLYWNFILLGNKQTNKQNMIESFKSQNVLKFFLTFSKQIASTFHTEIIFLVGTSSLSDTIEIRVETETKSIVIFHIYV